MFLEYDGTSIAFRSYLGGAFTSRIFRMPPVSARALKP
jgi:hypothetical protein